MADPLGQFQDVGAFLQGMGNEKVPNINP